jgi:hypothetical protein
MKRCGLYFSSPILRGLGALLLLTTMGVVTAVAQYVADGRFTNIYVYQPSFPGETWDQHMKTQRPSDWDKFTSEKIDAFTDALMTYTPGAHTYFDWLNQYGGIHPPLFLGSAMVRPSCLNAALKDAHNGPMQSNTIRSLANCHPDGMDPSPQITLIFSPEILIGNSPASPGEFISGGTTDDLCKSTVHAWHSGGLNVPDFIALPTNAGCSPVFANLTTNYSHEIVETLTDPKGLGFGGFPTDPSNPGKNEVGDKCQGNSGTWNGYTVTQYWSNNDRGCQPAIFSPAPSTSERVLKDVSDNPIIRFSRGDLPLMISTDPRETREVKSLRIVIFTGSDDLRGDGDNCDVTITLRDGRTISLPNVNQSGHWDSWTINSVNVPLPAGGLTVGDVTAVNLHKTQGGFDVFKHPDNWNIQRVQLRAILGSPLVSRFPQPRTNLPNTTITVTVTRVGALRSLGPRRPGGSRVYPMIRIQDGEFEKSPLSRSMLEFGNVPIEIEVWQDLPDYKGSGNSNDPNDPSGRGVHNGKATLRTLNIVYDLKTHEFTVTAETKSALRGRAGTEFVLPGDGMYPDVAFIITDQPGTH